MASSFSSSSLRPKYQVFLSFRGEDTRHNFTSHLLKALKDRGISVYFDEEKLESGEELSQALLKAIAESQIAIVILSKDYASSSWCLRELFEIMEWYKKGQLVVVPIFYHIQPREVRKHGGSFKKSFYNHQKQKPADEVEPWKASFAEVGTLKGWHIVGNSSDRSDSEHIVKIIEDVVKKLNSKSSSGSEEFVGLDAQKLKILKLIRQNDVRVIGICGQGGVGKTTLAQAVYKEVSPQFVGNSFFLLNVREKIEKQGMEFVVSDFLRSVLNQDTRIGIPLSGMDKDRLGNKRVFVVFDDVNHLDLIENLGVKYLGPGSKIIVTSRDQQVLRNTDAKIHRATYLEPDDSLKLLSKFSFKQENPSDEFWDLANKVANYARGLPLTLKVLGSALYQQSREVWESLIDKLKECPEEEVFSKLKLSLNGLNRVEKNIFLDIACFFKEYNREVATSILDCCYNNSARSAITRLVDKCLVEISNNTFDDTYDTPWMHDSLQEMGWEIIRLESEDPGKRSRIWRLEDIDDKVTDSIKAISIDRSYQIGHHQQQLCSDAFEKMTDLRLINFFYPSFRSGDDVLSKVDLKFLSNELRYLRWASCPFKSLPSSFNAKNLVELRLPRSKIEILWSEEKDLLNLRVLDLQDCFQLRKIPNLSRAIKLEVLNCSHCPRLVELPSMEHLTSLRCLNLRGCSNIKIFPEVPFLLNDLDLTYSGIEVVPDSIGHLTHLKELALGSGVINISSNLSRLESLTALYLFDCQVTKFPELPRNLSKFELHGTRIEEVPSSISRLEKLEYLVMINTRNRNLPSSIVELHALKVVRLWSCSNLTIFPSFPEEIEAIGMQYTSIEEIPSSISRLKRLKRLELNGSSRLKSLHDLPPFIDLEARSCKSIQTVSFADPDQYSFCKENVSHSMVFDSFELNGDAMDNIAANALLRIHCIAKQVEETSHVELAEELEEEEFDGTIYRTCTCKFRWFIPGRQILEPLEHQRWDSSVIVKLDPDTCSSSSLLGFAFGILLDQKDENLDLFKRNLLCKWKLKTTSGECSNFMIRVPRLPERKGEVILFDPIMVHEAMPYVEASFQFVSGYDRYFRRDKSCVFKAKKYGVHIFYKDADRMGRNIQLPDGAECSEDEDEDEGSFSLDNGHEPEPTLSLDGGPTKVSGQFINV
ncbi:hypothetical protein PTKIN_Ptkin15bG0188000 [Pterospermum kingtungense]